MLDPSDPTEAPKTDFYLKLPSESDVPSVLSAFYVQDYTTVIDPETGEETQVPEGDPYLVKSTPDYAIDIVGLVYKETGNVITDPDIGFEYPEQASIDGWHINIRLGNDSRRQDGEALSAYFVDPEPATPARTWL
jgi:hypothetical protein